MGRTGRTTLYILLAVCVAGGLVGVTAVDAATTTQKKIPGAPEWLADLVRYLDGEPVTDPEFWTSVQNLISTRLHSTYKANTDVNIIIQGKTLVPDDDDVLEVRIKKVTPVGYQTVGGIMSLLVDYDVINTGQKEVKITDMTMTMLANGRYAGAATDGRDYTVPFHNSAEGFTKMDVVVIPNDDRTHNRVHPGEQLAWLQSRGVLTFEGVFTTTGDGKIGYRAAFAP